MPRHKPSADGKKHSNNTADPGGSQDPNRNKRASDGTRETVESIVVAFILAFLFRTFEAEAFVIPTGSMAPTLYGRHKELTCEKCSYRFTIGASGELNDGDGTLRSQIHSAFCPNCRYEVVADRGVDVEDVVPFNGDRILVNKFPYEFGEPDRWDVIVFKYPEEPKTNYIKRLVGLPGEAIHIQQGDVYAKKDGVKHILRKDDPDKQRDLQILVYDNDFPETELHVRGWPKRWAAVKNLARTGEGPEWHETTDGWRDLKEQNAFELRDAEAGRRHWLRYRHIVPSPEIWIDSERGRPLPNPSPRLITDFCGYNAYTGADNRIHERDFGYYWVGDLTLRCQVDVQKADEDGEVVLELNEGARRYQCRFDIATGQASIMHNVPENLDEEEWNPLGTAETTLKAPGSYAVAFANVDDRLSVWMDGDLVRFDRNGEYKPFGGVRQQPTQADLAPVGIAAKNADVTVSHLLIKRDIYYRAERGRPQEYQGNTNYLDTLLTDPTAWYHEYRNHSEVSQEFQRLADDEFFVMGDNSPRSRDSRLWENGRQAFADKPVNPHAVPRDALVGKAFFIYWPHGVPFLNDGHGFPLFYHSQGGERTDYPSTVVPFYPNVSRMRRIR